MNEEQVKRASTIAALIMKHMQDRLTTKESEELESWLSESSENYLLFEELTNMNQLSDALKEFVLPDKDASLNRLYARLAIKKKASPLNIGRIWPTPGKCFPI